MSYIFKNPRMIYDPFYQKETQVHPWEYELLQSSAVKRLKFLSHYGTASFTTSAKHSRYEHTVGVWTIIANHFPKEEELRIAALLHDIGHLPFSHAVERTLGFNHHIITEEYILSEEVSSILKNHGFTPSAIIDLLNIDTPVSHKTPFLSADHLDSFLRDAYMLGKLNEHPSNFIDKISFTENYVEADLATSRIIMEAILADHLSFLKPIHLALDAILAKSISIYASHMKIELKRIQYLTNHELLQLLIHSNLREVNQLLELLLWNPERIRVSCEEFPSSEKIEVKKVYDKSPLVQGTPLNELLPEANDILEHIRSLKKTYYYSY
ncbi:HD domain-containing protein [Bacillus pinisoli]|uniref:HD domain-containing protein n=1 Tax=Bacillus pinisoli TaxID=2901866 RepID=UPI001FF3EE52|nr:HD domain-containing protein [Bacillus pinisoli]